MKKILVLMIAVLLVAGCKKKEGVAPIYVHVNNFTISQEEFPSKDQPVEEYAGVKAITLAFFKEDGSLQYCNTQLRADPSTYTTFGEFDYSLPMGNYTMEVLGYGSETPITLNGMTEAIYTEDKVRETFVATQEVEVEDTDPITINATLNRVIAKIHVKSTDGRPETVETLKVTFSSGGKGVNPLTGLATSDEGFFNTLIPTSAFGVPTNFISYLFLNSDEQNMDMTIEAINYDGETVFQKEVEDVPMQRNRITILTGEMYTAGTGSSFTINTDYISDTIWYPF